MGAKAGIVLILCLLSGGVFAWGVYQRLRNMMLGQPGERFGRWGERLGSLVTYVFGQLRLFRVLKPGTAHFFIFWGFVVLFPTIAQAILEGLFPGAVIPFFVTWGPLVFLQDILATVVSGAVVYGLYLRLVVKPPRYEGSHRAEGVLVLCFIFTIMVSVLLMNGIGRNLGAAHVQVGAWQPVSTGLGLLFAGLAPATQAVLFEVFYWIHLGVVLMFLPLLPVGKHFHIVTSMFQVLLRNLEPRGKLGPAPQFEKVAGVQKVEQFRWRQMLDWYSCTECGRCQDVCPAHGSGQTLSPKQLIMTLRDHLYERGLHLRAGGNGAGPEGGNGATRDVAGEVIPASTIWACTTCFACDQECPLFVEHVGPIVDMRRNLLSREQADSELMGALTSLRRYGNSFGQSDKKRAAWTRSLKPTRVKDARKEPVFSLWYLGDYASYSPALTEVTQATARVLERARVDFGILYDAERNAGNDVRRVGEEGLFEMLALKNSQALAKCGYEEIITTDPHTYNTLKHEYPQNGDHKPVLHVAEVLERQLAQGRLEVRRPLRLTVTYHDPCYLGRYNGVYDAPRRVLEAIGCTVVEMPRSRDRALCCGAGGGRIWMNEEGVQERPSENRIREALELGGVQTFVVACPKDLTMYRDAVKTAGEGSDLVVKDLVELVDEATAETRPGEILPEHSASAMVPAASGAEPGREAGR